MSVKENKELVTRFFKEFLVQSRRDQSRYPHGEYYDPKFVYHMVSGEMDYPRTKQNRPGNVQCLSGDNSYD